VKVAFSNFKPTTNPLSLPFLAFQHQFPPDNSAFSRFNTNFPQTTAPPGFYFIPGLKNVVAVFWPRPPPHTTGSVAATMAADLVDFEEMAAEQHCCLEMQRLLVGTSLRLAFRQTGAQRLAGDVSTGTFHPIVPLTFRKGIFDHFHNVAHPGRLASRRIISSRFMWHRLSSNVTAWACGCLACQRGKIHRI
jgi:hypothetical protein